MNIRPSRTAVAAVALTTAVLALAGCGSSDDHSTMPDMPGMHGSPSHAGASSPMSGMPMAHGNGLSASADGYDLTLRSRLSAGKAMPVRFQITRNSTPVTDFLTEQTKKLHFYLIRSDLSGFQHLHPTMDAGGTWSVQVPALEPGRYRIYTQVLPATETEPIVLSVPVTVPGKATTQPLPAPAASTSVDGYTVTLDGAATNHGRLRLSVTKGGKPVTDLQPYLETYAHVTAFHEGDLAFTHLHPSNAVTGTGGGPDLDLMVEVPETGTYRLFIQFMTDGTLHTAAVTTTVS